MSEPIGTQLRDAVDEAFVQRAWRGTERRRAVRRRRRLAAIGGALAVAIVLGAMVGMRKLERDPTALPLASTIDVSGPAMVRFGDGSTIRLLDGAHLESRPAAAGAIGLELVRGTADLDLVGSGTAWTVEAGLALMSAMQSHFTVARDGGNVRIEVLAGQVALTSEEGAQLLTAGTSIEVVHHQAVAPEAPPVEKAPPPPARPAPKIIAAATAPIARDLLAEADELRASGKLEAAAESLTQFLREQPSDPEAPLAGYILGELLSDLGRRQESLAAFGDALERGLPPELEAEARARLEELRAAP